MKPTLAILAIFVSVYFSSYLMLRVVAPYEASIPIVFVSFGPPHEEVVRQNAPLNDPEAIFYIPRPAVAVIANGLEIIYSPLVYLDFKIMSETFSPSLAVQYSLWN